MPPYKYCGNYAKIFARWKKMLNITNILLWFLQGTSGAIAGYITNKYAVNMLFKEYTPFRIGDKVILPYKFGGVIKNRKLKWIGYLKYFRF